MLFPKGFVASSKDIDHLDLQVRQKNLKARGEPCLLQLCVVPAYAAALIATEPQGARGIHFCNICTPLEQLRRSRYTTRKSAT